MGMSMNMCTTYTPHHHHTFPVQNHLRPAGSLMRIADSRRNDAWVQTDQTCLAMDCGANCFVGGRGKERRGEDLFVRIVLVVGGDDLAVHINRFVLTASPKQKAWWFLSTRQDIEVSLMALSKVCVYTMSL